MKSILDPSFRYVPSGSTDLRKTFSRVRREMQRAGAQGVRSGDPARTTTQAVRSEARADAPSASRVLTFNRAKEIGSPR